MKKITIEIDVDEFVRRVRECGPEMETGWSDTFIDVLEEMTGLEGIIYDACKGVDDDPDMARSYGPQWKNHKEVPI